MFLFRPWLCCKFDYQIEQKKRIQLRILGPRKIMLKWFEVCPKAYFHEMIWVLSFKLVSQHHRICIWPEHFYAENTLLDLDEHVCLRVYFDWQIRIAVTLTQSDASEVTLLPWWRNQRTKALAPFQSNILC